ncbi:response regulator [Paenibacillus sp. GD4]|jgi:two-component system, response regulator YesN|uniref:response regulator transcription factor n=1 Tax=Paenibacillus sp. GD4 TaxID=3068890 RepID=UPI002796470B|nr:response regulator [Paenibacillus sp. GD4]MDQ1912556.1 response regulator [Paenibacillus sp. GD4]
MWKVLLVEDEVFVRESVKELIRWEEMGFTVVGEAGDGAKALELITAEPPDLVLSDIVMPKMDGIELLKETRRAGIQSRFVMLTCLGDFEYVRQAMEYGASNYILKLSMSVKDLRDTLQKIRLELEKTAPTVKESEAASAKDKIKHPEVNKIIQYIEEHYQEEITVKQLSQQVMMGENYVSTLFKKKTGKTIIHYLHELRVKKAIEYLLHTDMTVSEIGIKVGFFNDNYFIKIFKRMTGSTPNQYRKSESSE